MQPTTDDAASADAIPPINGTSTYRPIEEESQWRYNACQVENPAIELACPSHVVTICDDDILWTSTGSINDIPLDLIRQNYLEKALAFTLDPHAIHEAAVKSHPDTAGKRNISQNAIKMLYTTSHLLGSHKGTRTPGSPSESGPSMVNVQVKRNNRFTFVLPWEAENDLKEIDVLSMFKSISFTMEREASENSVYLTQESLQHWITKDTDGRKRLMSIPSQLTDVGSRTSTAKSLWIKNPLPLTCNIDSPATKVSPGFDEEKARSLLRKLTAKEWDISCISCFEISAEPMATSQSMMGSFVFR